MFARSLNSSKAMCCVVAGSTLAFVSSPGFARAVSTRSASVWNGEAALTATTCGEVASHTIGAKLAAVRRRARNKFGADDRGGARAVFDHRRHAGIASDLLRQHANEKVGAAAGRKRNNESDGFRRLRESLAVGNRRQQCQPGGGRGQLDQSAARDLVRDRVFAREVT